MKIIVFLLVFITTFIITTLVIQMFKAPDKIVSSIDLCQKRHIESKTVAGPLYGNAVAGHIENVGSGEGKQSLAIVGPSIFGGLK